MWGFDAPARDWPPHECAEALVKAEPRGAFILLGYSLGGNLAFEVAKELEGRGRAVSDIILLDSSWREAARSVTEQELEAEIDMLLREAPFADGRMRAAVDGGGRATEAAGRDKIERLLKGWYGTADGGRVEANLHFLTSAETSTVKLSKWRAATSGRFTHYEGHGGHLAMLEGENAERNGALLASILEQILFPAPALASKKS
jgi:thioesterase domain-containing protein